VLAIDAEQLSKVYRLGFWRRRSLRALDGLSLRLAAGEVMGLIGPNGAGKSTTIKLLLNLVLPTSGRAMLFGKDARDPRSRQGVGYVPENPAPYEYLTGREYVELQARLAGLAGADLRRRVDEVVELTGLGPLSRLQLRRYSKGMTQRTVLAGAVVAEPQLLILDEPTSGLDPLGRRLVRDLIMREKKRGAAVLFCTHIISDVESLCDRVMLVAGGRLVREGRVAEMLTEQGAEVEVITSGASAEAVTGLVGPLSGSIVAAGERTIVHLHAPRLQEALKVMTAAGVSVLRIQPVRFSLEDEFVKTIQELSPHGTVGGGLE
jgi:ABC-2 type transport system ATP-binding protein